jgi:LuxR family maltose regulon positive regulatory protein
MPVLATKLHPPTARRRLVVRPRLVEPLLAAAGSMPRLVLVAAPAGFGKTTLVTQWLARGPAATVAWLSLDPGDSDVARFLTHVVAALQNAFPHVAEEIGDGIGADALAVLEGGGGGSVEPSLVSLVNDLDTLVESTVLVLDDYHVIEAPAVHDAVTFLLDHLPGHVTLAITTRADPPLPLARLRGRGELVEVRARDLRFSSDEAAELLNEVMGLDLDLAMVGALEVRTEGWAAGLQLAALSAQSRARDADPRAVREFVDAFTGSHRFVLDYLVEEVLSGVSDDVRAFLLDTCVLEAMTGSLCDALTGRRDGHEALAELDRSNLFVVTLDDSRQWYRYHHLFRDVLRARLLAERPDRLPLLHRAAASWYADHHLVDDAVRHALAGDDHDHAAFLIESALPAMRRARQDRVMIGWIEALPDAAVRGRPVLGILAAWSRMMAGDLDGMERWLDDAEAALAAASADPALAEPWADTEDLRAAPASLWLYRAALAQARGDVEATMRHARHARDLAPADDHVVHGGASGFLGLAAWAAGDVAEALETFSDAVRSLHRAGNLVDELDATVVLADMWVTAGRPDRARALFERALATATGHGEPFPRATPDLHVGLAELDCERNELASARAHLDAAKALAERGSITENRHRWHVAAARIHAAAGDHGAVDGLLDEAEALYRPGSYPDVRPIAAVRARLHLAAGDLAAAEAWAEGLDEPPDTAEFLHEYSELTRIRVGLARCRASTARDGGAVLLEMLSRLDLLQAAAAARAGSLLEIGLLRALTLDARGEQTQALSELDQDLAGAPDPDGYVRLFLDEGEPMQRLLRLAAKQDGEALAAHARRLLTANDSAQHVATAVPVDEERVQLPDPLSDRELEVLRLLGSPLTGPEIAGQLFVSLNTFRTHTKRIFTKLDVTSRAAAVHRARELNLV